jgi:hypothetical protein
MGGLEGAPPRAPGLRRDWLSDWPLIPNRRRAGTRALQDLSAPHQNLFQLRFGKLDWVRFGAASHFCFADDIGEVR